MVDLTENLNGLVKLKDRYTKLILFKAGLRI